tara:strand:+ start:6177 stop:8366 length:2190 start_codon:yes stop_codon:yes gene_type:complete
MKWIFLLFLFFLIGVGFFIRDSRSFLPKFDVQQWTQKQVFGVFFKKVGEALGVEIDLQSLQGSTLSMTLTRHPFQIEMNGLFKVTEIGFRENLLKVNFEPKVVFRNLDHRNSESDPLEVNLDFIVSQKLDHFAELHWESAHKRWQWLFYGILIEEFKWSAKGDLRGADLELGSRNAVFGAVQLEESLLTAHWDGKKGAIDTIVSQLVYQKENRGGALSDASIEFDFLPRDDGVEFQSKIYAHRMEYLYDDAYGELEIRKKPIKVEGRIQKNDLSLDILLSEILKIRIDSIKKSKQAIFNLSWKVFPQSLKRFWSFLPKDSFDEKWSLLKINSGSLSAKGEAHGSISTKEYFQPKNLRWNSRILIQSLGLTEESSDLQLNDGILDFSVNSNRIEPSLLSWKSFSLKKWKSKNHKISWKTHWKTKPEWEFEFETDPQNLMIDPIKMEWGRVLASFFPLRKSEKKFKIETSLSIPSFLLQELGEKFCLSKGKVPPAEIYVDYPEIIIEGNRILMEGQSEGSLFGGRVRLEDLRVFRLQSTVPETQFSLFWEGIQLASLGQWLSFGEMDGKLDGFLSDVVLQKMLPTQFHFKIEGKPQNSSDIVLSSKAMKNLIQLTAGTEFTESMPGFAKWLAFGFPSDLLGGYDLRFMGFELFSKKGTILLQTLEPKAYFEQYKKHFFLWGNRFKMPLQSHRYPVILDAPAMGKFVRRMSQVIEGLKPSAQKENHVPSHCK